MKKLMSLIFIVVFGSTVNADEIRLSADEWCPYNCAINDTRPGFVIELARSIFKKKGHSITYELIPWNRAILEARKGTYHGLIATTPEEVPDFIFPGEEQAKSSMSFWVKKGTQWRFSSLQSLDNIRLGGIDDYSYSYEVDTYIQNRKNDDSRLQISYGENALETNVNLLLKDAITAFIADRDVMGYHIFTRELSDRIVEAGFLNSVPVYIAFSPKHPKSKEYAQILSEGIKELRSSGELATILKKYGLKDWK